MISAGGGYGDMTDIVPNVTDGTVPELPVGTAADSIGMSVAPVADIGAADIFGTESVVPVSAIGNIGGDIFMSDSTVFHILTLLLFVMYFFLVFRFRTETARLFKTVFTSGGEDNFTDTNNYLPSGFVNGMLVTGFMMIGIIAVKMVDIWSVSETFADPPSFAAGAIVVSVMLTLILVALLQRLLLYIAGAVTFSRPLTLGITALRRMFFTTAATITVPLAILTALSSVATATVVIYILAGVVIFFAIFYVYRLLILFINQKVSILFWILYLCAVEVMPLGIIILTALRYF